MFEKTLQKHDCASRGLLGKKKKPRGISWERKNNANPQD
jgi:ribosomal protein L37E